MITGVVTLTHEIGGEVQLTHPVSGVVPVYTDQGPPQGVFLLIDSLNYLLIDSTHKLKIS